jgi:hypothetical protein
MQFAGEGAGERDTESPEQPLTRRSPERSSDISGEAERALNVLFRAGSSTRAYAARVKGVSRMRHLIIAVLAIASLADVSLGAKDTSIAGTWTLSVEHIGVKLVLEQKNGAVTGTLDWPHGDPVKLTGAFTGDMLTFFGDSAGENFTIHVTATGSRKADGTLAGTLKAHFDEFNDAHEIVRVRNQEMPWTAVRGLHNVVHFPR